MKIAVFVNYVMKKNGNIVVQASNGSPEGPPSVVFIAGENEKPYVNKKYWLTIEEEENDR
jgi:hypothetical protein